MATKEPAGGEPTTWFAAVEHVLDPLRRAQSPLALVSGAETKRTPLRRSDAGDSSRALGRDRVVRGRVRDVVRALVASEVLEEAGAAYRLAPAWAVLTGPAARN